MDGLYEKGQGASANADRAASLTASAAGASSQSGIPSATHTPGPWGIEQTRDMLWVGPMQPDGHKVDHVVVGLNVDSELTAAAALRQLYNSRLIAAAPELLAALSSAVKWLAISDDPRCTKDLHAAEAALSKATGGAA